MKHIPDAVEDRRLRDVETRKADKLPPGAEQNARRKKARDHESSAHSTDWRKSSLSAPE